MAHLAAVRAPHDIVDVRGVPPELLEHLAALQAVHAHGAVERPAQHLGGEGRRREFGGWGGLRGSGGREAAELRGGARLSALAQPNDRLTIDPGGVHDPGHTHL